MDVVPELGGQRAGADEPDAAEEPFRLSVANAESAHIRHPLFVRGVAFELAVQHVWGDRALPALICIARLSPDLADQRSERISSRTVFFATVHPCLASSVWMRRCPYRLGFLLENLRYRSLECLLRAGCLEAGLAIEGRGPGKMQPFLKSRKAGSR